MWWMKPLSDSVLSSTDASPSRLVMTTCASATACGGDAATSAPSAAQASLRDWDTSHTITWCSCPSNRLATPLPMFPTPMTATLMMTSQTAVRVGCGTNGARKSMTSWL